MTPRVWATWLPSALFLLQAPGCLALSGPHTVTGTVGGSLSVQCQYEEEEFRGNKKYWCGRTCFPLRRNKIVETTESEREVRNGRVSIRDHPANLTFTVTMENLRKDDGGTYWCGINVPWDKRIQDLMFKVEVIVSPAPPSTRKIFTSTLGPPSSLPATTLLNATWPETPDPHQHPRSLLSSVHFLLLVFLKLPLFLSMLGAVLWATMQPEGQTDQQDKGLSLGPRTWGAWSDLHPESPCPARPEPGSDGVQGFGPHGVTILGPQVEKRNQTLRTRQQQ